ncbi:hypothetical protein, partial [Pseudomonas syringae]
MMPFRHINNRGKRSAAELAARRIVTICATQRGATVVYTLANLYHDSPRIQHKPPVSKLGHPIFDGVKKSSMKAII